MTSLTEPFLPISTTRSLLGEGVCYDPASRRIFWIDIKGNRLFQAGIDDLFEMEVRTEGTVSSIGLSTKHQFVCSQRAGFAFLDFSDDVATFEPIADPEEELPDNRFNDGKVDPFGGYWAGTMKDAEDDNTGSWYRLSPSGEVKKLLSGFWVTNGPAFHTETGRGYITDSARGVIFRFQVTETGFEAFEEHLRFATEKLGYPDGMTVDREGCLWVAFWDGGAVRRFDETGSMLTEIAVPARRPTSIEIVGSQLFVTTASIGLRPEEHREDGRLLTGTISKALGNDTRYRFDDSAF